MKASEVMWAKTMSKPLHLGPELEMPDADSDRAVLGELVPLHPEDLVAVPAGLGELGALALKTHM